MKNNNSNQGNEKMKNSEEEEIAQHVASALLSVKQRIAAWKAQQDRKNSAKQTETYRPTLADITCDWSKFGC